MRFYQEKIYQFEWFNQNGAGPLWCLGSSCIAAIDKKIFVSAWEQVKHIPPLNCARWILYEKTNSNWKILKVDNQFTREPAPVCVLNDGRIFVSANPFMLEKEAYQGVSMPVVHQFFPPDYKKEIKQPVYWCEPVTFWEHSYRNFATDAANCQIILFHNKGYEKAYWSLLDKNGKWSHSGKLYWPWGYGYEIPQRIRLCYNNVLIKNSAVYVFGTSDIVEPNPVWRQYKRQITGREWDFDFRRVFFSFTPDIKKEPFIYWIEIAEREKTAGYVRNADLYVDDNGIVHLLWVEKNCDERLREKFFPDEILTYSLKYAQMKNGKMIEKKDILFFTEEKISNIWGRFHITPEKRLFIFVAVSGLDEQQKQRAINYLIEIDSTGNTVSKETVKFTKPFTIFHTAGIRNGSPPSNVIHIYGHPQGIDNEVWYGNIEIN